VLPMRARAGAAGALAAVAVAATASAQEPVPPPVPAPTPPAGNFGGGFVTAPPKDPLGTGNMVIGLRVTSGKLKIEATIRGRCGGGTFPTRAKLAADGSFVAKGTNRRRPEPGIRVKTKYRISGTLTDSGITDGSARATNEIRVKGKGPVTCNSGTITYSVRRPVGGIGTVGAAPDARYYGVTSQKRHGARRGIVLRVSSDGQSLTRALYGLTMKCGKLKLPDVVDTPRRDLPIDAQGRVKDRIVDTFRDHKTVTRSIERFSGMLGANGAQGKLSINERTKSRKTGKVVERCKSGSIKWSAAPGAAPTAAP
jgi:hypothetical protein